MDESDWTSAGFRALVDMAPSHWDSFADMLETSFDQTRKDSQLPDVGLEARQLLALIQFVLSIPNRFETLEETMAEASAFLEEDSLPVLYDRLSRILRAEIVEVSKKRRFLAQHHERFFLGAKITTDLRAVFGERTFRPVDWIVSHILSVKFSHSNGAKEIFFALEPSDIRLLQAELQRALEKESLLVKHIQPPKKKRSKGGGDNE